LNFRYEIICEIDRGAFGQAIRCFDHNTKEEVAIKINRNTKFDRDNSKVEVGFLTKLRDLRAEYANGKERVVQLVDSFVFRAHHCLVFPLLGQSLFSDLQMKNFCGFDLTTVKHYAYQIIQGLIYLKEGGVIHCDLKPENILYKDEAKKNLVIIDFGSSCAHSEEGFSYVQSRYYRAPEIVLGIPYDH